MPEGYYRTGAAAKELNISTYHLRKLAESGSIEADYTGRQWRFPESEIARLKGEGVPPIPTTAEPEHRNPQAAGRNNAHRSEELAEEDPEVVESAAGVKIMENTVRRRKLDRDLEETEDWFRDRDEHAAQRQVEREEAERERQAQVKAEKERREWADKWLTYALHRVPSDAPPEVRLEVRTEVEAVLATLEPDPPRQASSNLTGQLVELVLELALPKTSSTQSLVDAAIEKASKPWRRRKEVEKAIQEAADSLPSQAKGYSWSPSEWDIRAKQDAAEAVANLRPDATAEEIRAAARHSVQPIIKQFEHEQACQKLVKDCWMKLPAGWTSAESEEAKEAVRDALAATSVSTTTERELEHKSDAALAPIQAAIDKRQADEHRREQEARRRSEAERRLGWRMSHVSDYLAELEREEKELFDGFSERWRATDKLKEIIQPTLLQELLKRPEMTDKQIERRIDQLVDQHLDDVLDELDEG